MLACVLSASVASAQTAAAPSASTTGTLRVYLDCGRDCDFDFLRREANFIDYVRDRKDAEVHVLVTTQGTGGGGRDFTMQFIGLGRFADLQRVEHYISSGTDTNDEQRRGFLRVFTLGLTPYLMSTTTRDRMRLTVDGATTAAAPTETTAQSDPWNLWIFRVGASTDLDGERSDTSRQFRGNFSANRTTDNWKFTISSDGQYNENIFTLSDGSKLTSESHNYNVRAVAIKSLDRNHWALLARVQTGASTQNNYKRNTRLSTGVEYSVFPYAESSNRALTFQWSTGVNRFAYIERTIYDKLLETRPDTSIRGNLSLRQPWGSTQLSAEYISYLHDLTKHRTELNGRIDLRLFRGLSLNTDGRLSLVHDQLYLKKGTASDEEILLRRQRLATGYRYEFSIGFSYQFGSIFNNVVNPRWDR